MYWIVFQRQKIQGQLHYPDGRTYASGEAEYQVLTVPAIFKCDTAEQACQAAARKVGGMGTYFAVEGTPWGVDLGEAAHASPGFAAAAAERASGLGSRSRVSSAC